jgi:carbonic anhydrase
VDGQKPAAVVLGCSDSRTAPEVIFDQDLGDIFVIRLAGNVATEAAIESIGYAVNHLGARLILVLGHTRCGALEAAVHHKDKKELRAVLAELREPVAASKQEAGDAVENAIVANVAHVAEKLRTSHLLEKAMAAAKWRSRERFTISRAERWRFFPSSTLGVQRNSF